MSLLTYLLKPDRMVIFYIIPLSHSFLEHIWQPLVLHLHIQQDVEVDTRKMMNNMETQNNVVSYKNNGEFLLRLG